MTIDLDDAIGRVANSLRASTVRVHDAGGRGSGSGIVWKREGLILTNAHVVRAATATIETGTGTCRARVVRRDEQRDLAALTVDDATDLVPAPRRDSSTLVPGELVVAVGNPLGFVGAVTAGLVHRCNARWVIADVRLAPGNSGGPLADAEGRVVGINSMIARGLALAIPTAAIDAFLGEADPRRIGVRLAAVRVAGHEPALLVLDVEAASIAERSGLIIGDTILDLEPHEIGNAASLDIVRGGYRSSVRLERDLVPERTRAA